MNFHIVGFIITYSWWDKIQIKKPFNFHGISFIITWREIDKLCLSFRSWKTPTKNKYWFLSLYISFIQKNILKILPYLLSKTILGHIQRSFKHSSVLMVITHLQATEAYLVFISFLSLKLLLLEITNATQGWIWENKHISATGLYL